jgi:NADP-dependent 3-hydroxy acid dehydrogenase YdfG
VAGIRALGRHALEFVGDVTDRERIRQVTDQVVKEWGRTDILVNSAGTVKRAPSHPLPGRVFTK